MFIKVGRYLDERGIKQDLPLRSDYEVSQYFNSMRSFGPAHITGMIERETRVMCNTFGVSEPTYLELNGPEEILRLRSLDDPSLLLLGSLGQYSAREFSAFAKKINPNCIPNVIDRFATNLIDPYAGERDLNVQKANALEMPFKSNSQEQVYTNFLLHAFVNDDNSTINNASLGRLFKEVHRVLNQGGSFVMLEMPFGLHITATGYSQENINELISIALRSGFSVENKMTKNLLAFSIRPDIVDTNTGTGGAKIDSYGFGQYGDKLLDDDSIGNMGFRFKKV